MRTPAPILAAAALLLAGFARAEGIVPHVAASAQAARAVADAEQQARSGGSLDAAVQGLAEALDENGLSLVADPTDSNHFEQVSVVVDRVLRANPALAQAFVARLDSQARDWIAQGMLEQAAGTRAATPAGLDAALRTAQALLAHSRHSAALALLLRVREHGSLTGRAKVHHQAMMVIALAHTGHVSAAQALMKQREDAERAQAGASGAQAGPPGAQAGAANANPALAAPRAELERVLRSGAPRGQDRDPWLGLWSAELSTRFNAPRLGPSGLPGQPDADDNGASDSRAYSAQTLPAADSSRVYADDGTGLAAWDALTGREIWRSAPAPRAGESPFGPTLRCAAAGSGCVVSYEFQAGQDAGPGVAAVQCRDAAQGRLIWSSGLESLPRTDAAGGAVPVGQPLIVDDCVIVAARVIDAQLNSSSWLVCLRLRSGGVPLWATQIATAPAAAQAAAAALESPVMSPQGVVVSTGTGAVACLDPSTGAILWLRRFPLPLGDTPVRAKPWDLLTPAVVGERVFAVTPDRLSMAVLDQATGALLSTVETGPGSALHGTRYLLACPQQGAVAAVGQRVVAVAAEAPDKALWSWPAGQGVDGHDAPALEGRVAVVADSRWPDPELLAIPTSGQTALVGAADGAQRAAIAAEGNSFSHRGMVVCASTGELVCSMRRPAALALCASRLLADPTAGAALQCLRVAVLAADEPGCAAAAVQLEERVKLLIAEEGGTSEGSAAQAAEVLEALLQMLSTWQDANPAISRDLLRLLDVAGRAAGQPHRSLLARAQWDARSGKREEAARALAALMLAAVPYPPVATSSGSVSFAVMVENQLEEMGAGDSQEVMRAVQPLLEAALDKAFADRDGSALRRCARLAHAVGSKASLENSLRAAEIADAGAAARLRAEFAPAIHAPLPVGAAPLVGQHAAVAFAGSLCPIADGSPHPDESVLLTAGRTLVLRKAPDWGVAWSTPALEGRPVAAWQGARLLLLEQGMPGAHGAPGAPSVSGALAATALDAKTGELSWRNTQLGSGFSPVQPFGWPADPPPGETSGTRVTLTSGAAVSLREVTPVVSGGSYVLLRRDGAAQALSPDDGTTLRWRRAGSADCVVAMAACPTALALGTAQRDNATADTFTTAPQMVAIDTATGGEILRVPVSDGAVPELQWICIAHDRLAVIGTDSGVAAWRLAGDDADQPAWRIDAPEAQFSRSAWVAGEWLVVQCLHGGLLAIDWRTGRISTDAFRADDSPLGAVQEILSEWGFVAVVRDAGVEFFRPDGSFLGRDTSSGERAVSFAVQSREGLAVIDVPAEGTASGGTTAYAAAVIPLNSSGKTVNQGLSVTFMGQPVSAARGLRDWILLSNGASVQAIRNQSLFNDGS